MIKIFLFLFLSFFSRQSVYNVYVQRSRRLEYRLERRLDLRLEIIGIGFENYWKTKQTAMVCR